MEALEAWPFLCILVRQMPEATMEVFTAFSGRYT